MTSKFVVAGLPDCLNPTVFCCIPHLTCNILFLVSSFLLAFINKLLPSPLPSWSLSQHLTSTKTSIMDGKYNNPAQAALNGGLRYLIWGGDGWIAGLLYDLLRSQGKDVAKTTIRMENRELVDLELNYRMPTHVLNCAGVTGRPNVDWCEDNKEATIRSNVIGTLNLADCCFEKGIHCTVFATGCTCFP
jgi:NAD dependent epimerase/dehydratase family